MEYKRQLILGGLLMSSAMALSAQTSTWKEGYKQVIPSSTINGLTAKDMFGDQVSLYTGEVTFTATDVSLPGSNVLDVSFRRKLEMTDTQGVRDWVIDLPHLEGTYPMDVGWTRKNALSGATGRCSSGAAAPPNATGVSTASGTATSTWEPGEFWSGDYLSLPGAGNEELLKVQSTGVKLPTDGTTYKWVTKSGWRFSCISTAKNDAGEGFKGVAPDGTIYYFDWFSSSEEKQLLRPGSTAPNPIAPNAAGGYAPMSSAIPQHGLPRKRVLIYPSRVADRFGNYVDYTYGASGLTSIVASDGRSITVTHGNPMTVTANGRTWTYTNNGNVSSGTYVVTLPDGSSWVYDLKAVLNDFFSYPGGADGSLGAIDQACDSPPAPLGVGGIGKVGTVKHPSGAVGAFTFVPIRHGRSYVDRNCVGYAVGNGTYYSYPYRPYLFDTRSLKSKAISGPGVAAMTWQYQYGAANNSWSSNCGSGCVATKYVDVIEPSGDKTRHVFSNRWRAAEGREIATEIYAADGSLRQRTDMTYNLATTGQAYPAQIGLSGNGRGDGTSMWFEPLYESKTVRDGRSFAWKVDNSCTINSQTTYCFDELGRPIKVIKSSAPSP